jgi:16S rRNA (adenine1518-N6/adenine1519-N6)-dimethyltransferase
MVDLIEGDALDYPFEQGLEGTGWVCVSNLPYNVATPILGRLVRMGALFDRLLLMFQKEVGERLSARRGSKAWGALSLDIQTWAEVEPRLLVPPEAFHPRPKVNSMVVEVRPRLEPATFGATPAAFHATVRAAFGQRRKTLRNALGAIYGRDVAEEALQRAGVDPGERAERLTPEEFGRLAQALHADGGRAS